MDWQAVTVLPRTAGDAGRTVSVVTESPKKPVGRTATLVRQRRPIRQHAPHGRLGTMKTRTIVHGIVTGAGLLCAQFVCETAIRAEEPPPTPTAAAVEAAPGTTLEELVALAEWSSPATATGRR